MTSPADTALFTLKHAEFLVRTPPGTTVSVTDVVYKRSPQHLTLASAPDIELHCSTCEGERIFANSGVKATLQTNEPNKCFLNYICRNCRKQNKIFSVIYIYEKSTETWAAQKFGEIPSFGPPTPSRTIKLIGPDRDDFLKGRRCENQGLGVGAFTYYRRVVENQKGRIFDEIVRVARHISPEDRELREEIEAAKGETQFTKAVGAIKAALPQALLVNGQNPLVLLHAALSEGVHAMSDDECLELATSIRIVLTELSDRLSQAMKDEVELNDAVNRLIRSRSDKKAQKN